jgi:rare lipoprotein A
MSHLGLVAAFAFGLLLSACAQSGLAQTADGANVAVSHGAPSVPNKAVRTRSASYGIASYYSRGARTASGERYDPRQLTAAHRTLPFGTRLLVTDIRNGRSVVVRVNDRGPFVHGRIVDVSYAAARQLNLTASGTGKVKLEVLEQ